jgi:hypothetical protein
MTYSKCGAEEFASGMVICPEVVKCDCSLRDCTPCVFLAEIDKGEISIHRLSTVGGVRLDSLHGQVSLTPYEGYFSHLSKV